MQCHALVRVFSYIIHCHAANVTVDANAMCIGVLAASCCHFKFYLVYLFLSGLIPCSVVSNAPRTVTLCDHVSKSAYIDLGKFGG